jgi:hypothetical protein
MGIGSSEKHQRSDTPNQNSDPLRSRRDFIEMSLTEKEMVEEIKIQWKCLWQERVDDKVRAEGIATNDYAKLFVEKGTIIHATRSFKALSFKEILEQNKVESSERFIPLSPQVGGWNKFIKTSITVNKPQRHRRALLHVEPEKEKQQSKKGGRGWLHK